MKITVNRFVSDDDSTVSRIGIDGKFACFGLEDEFRAVKKVGETRIPAGSYAVGLRTEGGHHAQYRQQFPQMHRGMLHIQKVPGFEFILVHCGNTQADTAGCLLVGSSANTEQGNMSIGASRVAYRLFYPKVVDAAAKGTLSIEFIDSDR